MELINNFKKTLLEQSGPASKVTVKNYIADVKKFAIWFEATYKRPFPPSALPKEIVEAYIAPLRDTSPRSAKRYVSSLRKFFAYLTAEKVITYNPLLNTHPVVRTTDVWHIRDFDNFLYNSKAGQATIKNYIADVRQFVNWIAAVNPAQNTASSQPYTIANIDAFLIEEYKNRLLEEAGLSPLSVNRKLSSLRKYLSWAHGAGFIKDNHDLAGNISSIQIDTEETAQVPLASKPAAPQMTLASLNEALKPEDITPQSSEDAKSSYSRFAPIRLLQKTKAAIGFLFDSLLILSVIKSIEAIKFNLWKATGKQVFAPLPVVIKSMQATGEIANGAIGAVSTSLNPAAKTQSPSSSPFDKFVRMGHLAVYKGKFHGISKSIYAPMKISTRSLPFWKKAVFHLRFTRPNWYKKYHTYSFVHYTHFGIVLIIAVILGFRIYQPFITPDGQTAVLASRIGPHRHISFQGRLLDASGSPITRQSPVRFAIYKSETASGSALLWQETQTVNPDGAGSFLATIGKVNPIDQEIFTQNPNLYLGISIGNSPELTPRQALANFSLSKNAEALQGLKPITGNNAGTENVILALDSSGNLTIGGDANPIFQATGGEFTLSGQQLSLTTNPGTNTNIVLNPDGTGIIDLQKPLQNTSENNNLSTALGAVEIDDNLAILASSSAQSALVINQNGTGELISASTGSSARFTVSNSGTVMIGEDLNILGNNLTTVTGTFSLANTNTLNLNIGGAATSVSIGAKTGTTTINHNLDVIGHIKATGGITLPNFTAGTIPFIGAENRLASDSANLFWDNTNKRLGIGTTSPTKSLDVQGGVEINLPGIGTGNALCHSSQAGIMDQEIVDCVGTPTADYMEIYSVETGLEIGDIAAPSLDYITTSDNERVVKLKKSTAAYQSSIIGIISDKSKAGDFNSIGHNIKPEDNPQPIALNGRVPVKISSNSPEIKPGDYLTTSADPGKAMKATGAGVVVGKALESWDSASGKDKIMVYVNLSWFDPRAVLMNDGSMSLAFETRDTLDTRGTLDTLDNAVRSIQNFVSTLESGVLELQHISVQSINIASEDIKIGTQTLREYIAGIVNEIMDKRLAEEKNKTIIVLSPLAQVSAEASTSATVDPQPTISLTPTPGPITPSPLASQSATYITNIYNNIATESAQLTIDTDTNASVSAQASSSAELSPSPTASPSATPTQAQQNTQIAQQNGDSDAQTIRKSDNADSPSILSFPKIQTNHADIATFSAELYYVPNLKSDFATFTEGLIALGPTSLTEVSIATQLSIGSTLRINDNSLNTIGTDLNIQPLRQGNLAIMGGLVTVDTEGNLTVEGNATFAKDVTVKGTLAAGIISPLAGSDVIVKLGKSNQESGIKNQGENPNSSFIIHDSNGKEIVKIDQTGNIIASGSGIFANLKLIRGAQADTSFTETVASGSAGTAVITANETERTIRTPFVNVDSLIYITPVSSTLGTTPYIARQTIEDPATSSKGSFTIQIPNSVASNIKLNWWIIN